MHSDFLLSERLIGTPTHGICLQRHFKIRCHDITPFVSCHKVEKKVIFSSASQNVFFYINYALEDMKNIVFLKEEYILTELFLPTEVKQSILKL